MTNRPSQEDIDKAIHEAERELNISVSDCEDGDPALDLILTRAGEILKKWGFDAPEAWKIKKK